MSATLEPIGKTTATSGVSARNWFGNLVTHPRVVVHARTVDDIVEVMRDAQRYPAPVRARGSAHSATSCIEADGGTLVDMTQMSRIIEIGEDTVRVEAGALYIDVAKALQAVGRQFYVNLEIGTATVGSLACCPTKDASMPGELGNVSSYCVGMKLVTASGDVLELTEEDADLMRTARSSFGLLGIVFEVTFRIRPLQAMVVRHSVYRLEEFLARLPELSASDDSMMWYGFPFIDRVAVESRRYTGNAATADTGANLGVWRLRNFVWKSFGPSVSYALRRVPGERTRNVLLDSFHRTLPPVTAALLHAGHTVPTDQMVRFPEKGGTIKYTFSICAFPEGSYPNTVREYNAFVKSHYARTAFRPDLPDVGYRIVRDDSSLLSYAGEGNVMTVDPISTGRPGWEPFLDEYNAFCSDHGGYPLFNQTPQVTREQARRAYGERLDRLELIRREHDPGDRLLNGYFREYLRPD